MDVSILMLVYVSYFIILTMIFGKTIGKMIVGIKVVSSDGKRAMPHQILIRYVTKYILYFEVFYVIFSMDNLSSLGDNGLFISIMILVTIAFIYFRTIISAINKKNPLVYEQLSNTKHISTIKHIKEEIVIDSKIENDKEIEKKKEE